MVVGQAGCCKGCQPVHVQRETAEVPYAVACMLRARKSHSGKVKGSVQVRAKAGRWQALHKTAKVVGRRGRAGKGWWQVEVEEGGGGHRPWGWRTVQEG